MSFAGEKADDSGITKAIFSLEYDPATKTLAGSESWVWAGDSGVCSNGLSKATAIRK